MFTFISNFLPYRYLVFSLFSFDSNKEVDFSFLHCRHVDLVTTPCFQAPRILCWGTEPPSSRLLSNLIFAFFFFFRPTDPKSENAFDNKRKKRGWPNLISGHSCSLENNMLIAILEQDPLCNRSKYNFKIIMVLKSESLKINSRKNTKNIRQ